MSTSFPHFVHYEIRFVTMNLIAVTVRGTCLTCSLVWKGARLKLIPHYCSFTFLASISDI